MVCRDQRAKISLREKRRVASHGNVRIFCVAGGAGSVETTTPVAFERFRADVQPAFRRWWGWLRGVRLESGGATSRRDGTARDSRSVESRRLSRSFRNCRRLP